MKIAYSKIIKWIISIIITFVLLLFIFNNREDFRFILDIKYRYLFAILSLILLSLSLVGYRYYLTIRAVSNQIAFSSCFKYFIIGRFLNKIVPQAGSIYRAVSFKKRNGFNYNEYVSSYIFFFWIDFTLSFLIGAILIGLYDPALTIGDISMLGIFISLFFLCILSVLFLSILYKLLPASSQTIWRHKVLSHLKKALDTILSAIKNRRLFLNSSINILLNTFLTILIIHLCFKSINIDTSMPILAVFVVITRLSNAITVTPGNFGIREFVYGFLSGAMGIGMAEGIGVSMILRISTFVIQGVLSLIFILSDKFEK